MLISSLWWRLSWCNDLENGCHKMTILIVTLSGQRHGDKMTMFTAMMMVELTTTWWWRLQWFIAVMNDEKEMLMQQWGQAAHHQKSTQQMYIFNLDNSSLVQYCLCNATRYVPKSQGEAEASVLLTITCSSWNDCLCFDTCLMYVICSIMTSTETRKMKSTMGAANLFVKRSKQTRRYSWISAALFIRHICIAKQFSPLL